SVSHTHSLSHSYSLSLTHTHTHTLMLTLSLSHTHTHTHTHTYTHCHSHSVATLQDRESGVRRASGKCEGKVARVLLIGLITKLRSLQRQSACAGGSFSW